jgi:hypothetical protein
MKRQRPHLPTTTATRRLIVSLCILLSALSMEVVLSSSGSLYSLSNGATTTYQGCIPRRRQRQVDVTDISILCDRVFSNDDDGNQVQGYSYFNKPTCLAGDVGKLAIACKSWQLPENTLIVTRSFLMTVSFSSVFSFSSSHIEKRNAVQLNNIHVDGSHFSWPQSHYSQSDRPL